MAAREYYAILLQMHRLNPLGAIESGELDALCLAMERLWPRMNAAERDRANGLSEDLYAVAEGRRGVAMPPAHASEWAVKFGTAGDADPDATLVFLRRPFPAGIPGVPAKIAFLQGLCWEKIGELEVSSAFVREGAKTLPEAERYLWDLQHRSSASGDEIEHSEKVLV